MPAETRRLRAINPLFWVFHETRKRQRRDAEAAQRQAANAVDADTLDALEDQDVSTDPADYEDVPRKAYITVKEPKPGYRYYYWQWRDGDTWNNKYIAPVNPRE